MRILDGTPALARRAAAALAAVTMPIGAGSVHAQRPPSVGRPAAGPAVAGSPATSRLPRLLDGGAAPAARPGAQAGRGGWGWPAQEGWSSGRPIDASGHAAARRRPRRVQPLVVLVSPYASVYASSSGGCGWVGAASCSAAPTPVEVDTAARRAVRTKVIEVTPGASVAPATADAGITVDRLPGDVLRLRWGGSDPTVREVELVIADSARRVLASQRVHAAPYAALFARDARTALVGVSVLRSDGTSTLTLVPLREPTPRRD